MYVHLANGEILRLNAKELAESNNNSAPGTIHRDGRQHTVIGVYPEEVELVQNEDEKAESEDKAEFAEWKANRSKTTPKKTNVKEKGTFDE